MPIDINRIREDRGYNPDELRKSEKARFRKTDTVGDAMEADASWRREQYALDQLRKDLGVIQKAITEKKKATKGQDPCDAEMVEKLAVEAKITEQTKKVEQITAERDQRLGKIGNIVHESVLIDNNEDNNPIVRTWGAPRQFAVDGKTPGRLYHHQVLQMLEAYDQDPRGINVAGHRGYFLKGVGVLLNMALMNYGISFLMKKGYLPIQPPFFMKRSVMAQTAQLSDFDEQLYKVSEYTEAKKAELGLTGDEGEYYLIATSEQPISALHMNEWLNEKELPKKYAGISSCFRKEAGAHGRDTWGLFRIHQFEKIEQFVITEPEQSWDMHEEMAATAEEFLESLELPYRRVSIVSGALNDAAAKKYDIEAWFPAYQQYKELVSCSNCTDYQSRAMETRAGHVRQGDREKRYVHMLNSTLCATERCLSCIAENYQTETGLRVPKVLVPYMNGMEFIPYTAAAPECKEPATKAPAPQVATNKQ